MNPHFAHQLFESCGALGLVFNLLENGSIGDHGGYLDTELRGSWLITGCTLSVNTVAGRVKWIRTADSSGNYIVVRGRSWHKWTANQRCCTNGPHQPQ